MKLFNLLMTLALSSMLISCGNDDKSVKARRPTPPSIESRATYMVQQSAYGLQSTSFNKGTVQSTAQQIVGVDLYVSRFSNGSLKIDIDLVENLGTGCPTSRYTSGTINQNQLVNNWVQIAGGDMRVSCVDNNCSYIAFIIDRQTAGTPNNFQATSVKQTGAIVFDIDQNSLSSNPLKYVPTESQNKSLFLNAYDTGYGRVVCLNNPYTTLPAIDPNDSGNNDDDYYYYSYPYNNTYF